MYKQRTKNILQNNLLQALRLFVHVLFRAVD